MPARLSIVGVLRPLTWACSRVAAHWGQREPGLRAVLTQFAFPWSATSEWKPGHPRTQVAGICSQACPESSQLLENRPGPHTSHSKFLGNGAESTGWAGLSCRPLQAPDPGWSQSA